VLTSFHPMGASNPWVFGFHPARNFLSKLKATNGCFVWWLPSPERVAQRVARFHKFHPTPVRRRARGDGRATLAGVALSK
jgi:hypothetical protein